MGTDAARRCRDSLRLLTRYELGAIKLIPMRVHLGLDMASGVLLAVSPWLFGFSDRVFWPHLILGLIEIGTALMTEREPAVQHREAVLR
jgi:hypothetical protein